MKKQKLLLSSLLIAGACLSGKADVIINEVMQSNVYGIMDDLNDFPDSWVELHNTSASAVNIEGYRINVKDKFKSAYVLPSVEIPANGHILIYCDKAAQGLHTDFRVDSGKGNVFLYDADGNTIDQVALKKQPAPDIAYGRESDGSGKWGYQLTPTPGKANEGGISDVILGPVTFSESGGVWSTSRTIEVMLEKPENAPEGTKIYYTTDGSEPTSKSKATLNGKVKVTKSCVVRAKAICPTAISIPSTAQSYLFLDRDIKIPVISIAINNEYLYDTKIGIFSEGENAPTWGENLNANYFNDWRRPCNIEFFESEGSEAVINQLCETRVQGGYTRRNALKSLAVYANKRFGEKRLAYEFWAKDKPGVTDNKSIILRNGGNDFAGCYVRDGLIQRIIGRNTDIEWQGYSPAIIFINGEYHAMLAIRERSSEDNISANFGGLEDIDMFENWEELKAGDAAAMDEFNDFIKTQHSLDEWAQYINIESYTNLMALNYWIYNTDFPHNNTVMWRRTDGTDPRWRWLVKDCDFGLGIYTQDDVNKDYATFLNNNPDNQPNTVGYTLWRQLMKCAEFKSYFIDHLVVYMGDFLNANTFHTYLDEIIDENQGEQMISHLKWGGNMWWTPDLNGNIQTMRGWIDKRQNAITNIMKNGWKLGNAVKVNVNLDLPESQLQDMAVSYDNIPLTKGTFSGNDFVGRTIVIEAGEGSPVTGWTLKVGTEERVVESTKLEYTIADTKAITINAIVDDAGVADIVTDPGKSFSQSKNKIFADSHIEIIDMTGRTVASGYRTATLPSHGVFIVKTGNGRSSKVVW